MRVHDDHFAADGLVLLAGGGELLLGDELDVAVDGEDEVLPVLRRQIILRGDGERPAAEITQRPLEPVLAGELLLELQLQPFQADAILLHSAEQVGCE